MPRYRRYGIRVLATLLVSAIGLTAWAQEDQRNSAATEQQGHDEADTRHRSRIEALERTRAQNRTRALISSTEMLEAYHERLKAAEKTGNEHVVELMQRAIEKEEEKLAAIRREPPPPRPAPRAGSDLPENSLEVLKVLRERAEQYRAHGDDKAADRVEQSMSQIHSAIRASRRFATRRAEPADHVRSTQEYTRELMKIEAMKRSLERYQNEGQKKVADDVQQMIQARESRLKSLADELAQVNFQSSQDSPTAEQGKDEQALPDVHREINELKNSIAQQQRDLQNLAAAVRTLATQRNQEQRNPLERREVERNPVQREQMPRDRESDARSSRGGPDREVDGRGSRGESGRSRSMGRPPTERSPARTQGLQRNEQLADRLRGEMDRLHEQQRRNEEDGRRLREQEQRLNAERQELDQARQKEQAVQQEVRQKFEELREQEQKLQSSKKELQEHERQLKNSMQEIVRKENDLHEETRRREEELRGQERELDEQRRQLEDRLRQFESEQREFGNRRRELENQQRRFEQQPNRDAFRPPHPQESHPPAPQFPNATPSERSFQPQPDSYSPPDASRSQEMSSSAIQRQLEELRNQVEALRHQVGHSGGVPDRRPAPNYHPGESSANDPPPAEFQPNIQYFEIEPVPDLLKPSPNGEHPPISEEQNAVPVPEARQPADSEGSLAGFWNLTIKPIFSPGRSHNASPATRGNPLQQSSAPEPAPQPHQ